MDYLKAKGVPEQQITMRFHGERYPAVPNTTAANRSRNRRVNIQLERVTPAQTPAPEAEVAKTAARS
ncbi:flagellar motor protein MotD [compost metagenome]